MSGVTNTLLAKATAAAGGDSDGVDGARAALLAPHRAALLELVAAGDRRRETEAQPGALADEVARLLYSVYVLRELSPRASDRIVSFGERMSSVLVAAALNERGVPAQAVASDKLIVTDSVFGGASPLLDKTAQKARDTLATVFDAGLLPVVTGFFGADERGITTTLGRGGSDYSASILGHALDADEIWIWTDVDGVMTADPRLAPDARTLPSITYAEATEIGLFRGQGDPSQDDAPRHRAGHSVWIKNTFRPVARHEYRPGLGEGGVAQALASISGVAAITVEGQRSTRRTDVTARIFAPSAAAG